MSGYGIHGPHPKCSDQDRPTARKLKFVRTELKIHKKNRNIFPDKRRGQKKKKNGLELVRVGRSDEVLRNWGHRDMR